MPQLSLYIDDATMEKVRNESSRQGVSISRFARTRLSEGISAWPSSFWGTYGAATPDFSLTEKLDAELDGPLPSFDD